MKLSRGGSGNDDNNRELKVESLDNTPEVSRGNEDGDDKRMLRIESLDNTHEISRESEDGDDKRELKAPDLTTIDRKNIRKKHSNSIKQPSKDLTISKTKSKSLKMNTISDSKSDSKAKLPYLVPLDSFPVFSPESLLTALKEEPGITDPVTLHKNCYEAMNVLKEKHILDKYILNEDEAAALCAVPILLDDGFSFQDMVESCKKKAPSKFMLMMLTTMRNIPKYEGVLYFENETENEIERRIEGSIFQPFFCVASKEINIEREGSYKELFRVEKGWGYDISDFVLRKDDNGYYSK